MKMTATERLAFAEAAHAAQRAYRKVLDEAHNDLFAALDAMPDGMEFTPAELAAAAGVPYQALYTYHTGARYGLDKSRKRITKKYAAILPDGSVDLEQVITVTKNTTLYRRTSDTIMPYTVEGMYRCAAERRLASGDPSDILDYLAKCRGIKKGL